MPPIAKLGHEGGLIAPRFVKPYVKANKNDASDAEAICEAVTRPSMPFVAIKAPHNKKCERFIEYGHF
jgi:transposase